MKTDSATDLVAARLAQAIRDYVPRHPTKFQKLLPIKDSIAGLRGKGASYAAIADILRNSDAPVAVDTVFRFCHEILGEPMSRRHKRKKVPVVLNKRAREEPLKDNPTSVVKKADSQPVDSWRPPAGPRIANADTI
jgi:hypothetical protein